MCIHECERVLVGTGVWVYECVCVHTHVRESEHIRVYVRGCGVDMCANLSGYDYV